jgi:hypothetical protein
MVSEDQKRIPVSRPPFAYPVSPTDGPLFSRRICFKNTCLAQWLPSSHEHKTAKRTNRGLFGAIRDKPDGL